ncbi:MAG: MFS transporter [bacterium]|nr:MFS transporter [bacterium]
MNDVNAVAAQVMTDAPAVSKRAKRWDRLPEDYEFTRKDIARNMACCILMDAFFAFGFADLQIALQPLLVYLGASNTLIGFITGMNWLTYLGLFLSPWISRRMEYKKKYFFVTNIPYLLPLLVVGIAIIASTGLGWSKELLLTIVIWSFVFHWLFGGFVSLPHTEYIAACIPASSRATMSGISISVGSGLGILSTAIGYFILAKFPKPGCFGILFVMTWFITQVGYLATLLAKEKRTPVERAPGAWSKDMFRSFRKDKRFVRFTVIWGLFYFFLGTGVWSFINLYGLKDLGMLAKTAAIMGSVGLISRLITSAPMGAAIDRMGAKRVFPWLGIAGGLVVLPVLILRNSLGVYVSIALSSAYLSAFWACCMVLKYGLPKPEHRSGHFTILIMVQVIAVSLGAILIGRMLDAIGYIHVFTLIAVFGFALSPVTWFLMRDFPAKTTDFH